MNSKSEDGILTALYKSQYQYRRTAQEELTLLHWIYKLLSWKATIKILHTPCI